MAKHCEEHRRPLAQCIRPYSACAVCGCGGLCDPGVRCAMARRPNVHEILHMVPTEYVGGEWIVPGPDGPEPDAVITYATEEGPETGHVGWMWWARGKMGEATTYEAAKLAAEAVLRRVP